MQGSRTLFVAILAAVCLTALWTTGPTRAADPAPAVVVDPAVWTAEPAAGPMARPDQPISLYVRLSGPSVIQLARTHKETTTTTARAPLATATLRAMHNVVATRQAPAVAAIEARGITVVDSYQTVSNALLVHATRAQIPGLAQVPGVVAIERATILEPLLADATPQIGANLVWSDLGWQGEGSVVAVIDTGVDYTHAAFGGPGTVDVYDAIDPEVVDPQYFPTARVIGGYDLAGTYYSAACNPGPGVVCSRVPSPDDNPIDSLENNGFPHGTHVAGIVAGEAVAATNLSPGVAPAAKLVALKVFGNPAGAPRNTDLAMSAVEWVTEHNLGLSPPGIGFDEKIDVINMSLGSSFGGDRALDNEAIDAALEAGVTVVASAGNSGNVPFITGSPAASVNALSVASVHATGDKAYWFEASWGGNTIQPDALPGTDWLPTLDEVGRVQAPMAWYGLACDDENGGPSQPEQDVREKIALIERGTCPFYAKVKNAQARGAVGAVIFTTATQAPTTMGCGAPSPCDEKLNIPALIIAREPGLDIQAELLGGTVVTGVLDPANTVDLGDGISGFSSRGPARVSTQIKPQITAPGDDIRAAGGGTGDGAISTGGTSMSGPMVAGVAALLWQRNRAEDLGLEALDISALAMNYALNVVREGVSRANPQGNPVSVIRQGAGRVDAFGSATGTTLLRSAEGIAELNFGFQATLDDQQRLDRTVTVRNLADAPKTYKLASSFVFPEDANQGVGITFAPAELTVPAGESAEVTVTAIVTPNRLRAWNLRSFQFLMNVAALQTMEIDGFVTVSEVDGTGNPVAGGDVTSMPFYILPRHQGCVAATPTSPFHLPAEGDEFEQSWTNPCQLEAPIVPVPLIGSDNRESVSNPDWPAKLDLHEIGAQWGLQDPDDPTSPLVMIFNVATGGAARIPWDSEFRIYLDYNQDGKYDEVIYNLYAPLLTNDPQFALKFMVGRTTLAADGITPDYFNTSGTVFFQVFDVDDQVARLPVMAGELNGGNVNLASGNVRFNFAVTVSDFADDFAVTDRFLGYDVAPDDGLDIDPEQFTYDQVVADCLSLVGPGDEDLGRLGERFFTVPGGATNVTPLRVRAACAPPEDGADTGILMLNPVNVQGQAGYDVRKGRLGAAAQPGAIFLPYASKGHAFYPEVSLDLAPVGDEGVAGTARLVQRGNNVEVSLQLPDAATDTAHPAHIHIGRCESPGEVYRDLSPVVDGVSITLLPDLDLGAVTTGGHYINVHKSAEDLAQSISCGDIPTAQ